nr:MAG TPA: hypothetical protein [Caudoviricetes sp.]
MRCLRSLPRGALHRPCLRFTTLKSPPLLHLCYFHPS